jgi:hypothetical protein
VRFCYATAVNQQQSANAELYKDSYLLQNSATAAWETITKSQAKCYVFLPIKYIL